MSIFFGNISNKKPLCSSLRKLILKGGIQMKIRNNIFLVGSIGTFLSLATISVYILYKLTIIFGESFDIDFS